jgi:ankyrin repeat protein
VALLLQHGASTKRHDWKPFDTPYQLAKDGKHRWSPLHAAAFSGHRQIVHLLLTHGAPVNRANGWLRSPLHFAAEEGRRNVVQLLLKHGANPNGVDWQKYSPLHCAVARGHRAVAECLLDFGADPNARSLSANTPLHLAARRGRNDVAALLLHRGAQANAAAKKFTPLHEAAKEGHAAMVALLLANGADVDAQTSQRKTALHFAVLNRDVATEALLVAAGAFAAHLVPVAVEEDWVDMGALLEAEEGPDRVAALGYASGSATASQNEGPVAKSPFSAKSKFKSLSMKVAALA